MPVVITAPTPVDVSQLSTARANWLWEHVSRQDICFDDFSRGRGDLFAARLCSPSTVIFEYGDSGLILVENIVPKLGASVHFYLWDPKVQESDIIAVGRGVVAQMFEEYQLHRLTASPPIMNKLAERIAQRVGFKYEGTIRQTFLYKGAYLDAKVFGLLAHEFKLLRDVM